MKHVLVLAAVAALAGCGGNVFKVDARFTPEEERKIQTAADVWASVGAPSIDLVWRQHVTVFSTNNTITRATGREAALRWDIFRDDRILGFTHAHTFDGTQIVYAMDRLVEDVPGANLRATAIHEFGHVLLHGGSEVHSQRMTDIMYEAPQVDTVSAGDVAALEARSR